MKVRREVRICDECCDGDDNELVVAKNKCTLCDKDLCDNCCEEYSLNLGDNENEDNDVIIMEINCCEDCIKNSRIQQRKDKKFIEDISKQTIHYLKQKIMLKEIEK